jgi:hypothetical protein
MLRNPRISALLALCLLCVAVVRVLPRFLAGVAPAAEQHARGEVAGRLEVQAGEPAADEKIDRWIAEHGAEHAQRVAELEESFKNEHRFRGEDGRDHPYLGDLDSYLWLRLARNYLRQGTVCDRVVDGVCRDDLAPAPVGREQLYARSLHTAAIVGLHRVITLFSPGFPLPATSYYVPVILGVLGVIPAFLLGWRFGGEVGAVIAALASGTNPAFLIRSVGSDNDVWNVVVPLYALWACVASLAASSPRSRLSYAAAAGLMVSLHAAVWAGWILTHAVVFAGLAASAGYAALRYGLQQRDWRIWNDPRARAIALAGALYFIVAGIGVTIAHPEAGFVERHWTPIERLAASAAGATTSVPDLDSIVWPSHFATVAEIRKMRHVNPASYSANVPLLFVGFAGVALAVLPRRRWQRSHLAVGALGAAVLGYIYTVPESTPMQVPVLLLPAALALAAGLFSDRSGDDSETGGLVLVAWIGAAYYFGSTSNRFVMFLAAPVALGLAVCAHRAGELLITQAGKRLGSRGGTALRWIVAALVLAYPLQRGYETARKQLPQMNDAWWETMAELHRSAPEGSIVNAWWHDGHWITYGTERAVLADGASLRTHIPYWFVRALLTPDEAHSVGLMRMLACGSDATPYPEKIAGAYTKLRAHGLGVLESLALVDKLAVLGRTEAAAELGRNGLPPETVADVLVSTHCKPPPSYLVLSNSLSTTAGWAVGHWDFRRAFAARWAAQQPRDEGVQALMQIAGYQYTEARTLYDKAPRDDIDAQREFIVRELGYLTKDWIPCELEGSGATRVCLLASRVSNAAQVLEGFEYSSSAPAGGRLRIRDQRGGQTRYIYRVPGTIFLAGPARFDETHPPAATDPGLAVLVDTVGNRLLLAEAELLRSTFTKLMFLDGRYLRHFEKIQERAAYTEERVVSFRVRHE